MTPPQAPAVVGVKPGWCAEHQAAEPCFRCNVTVTSGWEILGRSYGFGSRFAAEAGAALAAWLTPGPARVVAA